MCGIAGWVNFKKDISGYTSIINKMVETIEHRGPDASGTKIYNNALLGHRRLTVIDPEGGSQPMTKCFGDKNYTLVYNGELYNTKEVREKLKAKGYSFNSYSDTEVLLTALVEWRENCLDHINGIYAFAFWDESEKSLLLVRDPLGVKPLFYAINKDSLIFGSELKVILAHPDINAVVGEDGLLEILALGPARTLGNAVFKNIKEIPAGYYLKYQENSIKVKEYWQLEAKEHKENFEQTSEHVRQLLTDAIERQLVSDVPLCTFLSGGLDSSIISAVTANAFKKQNKEVLTTYSIDYLDNEKYFKANKFQPNSDQHYIKVMTDYIGSKHNSLFLNNNDLALYLKEAVLANDLPGMADIDSSLYLFCKEVRKNYTVALSGECADEIFAGYPWFRDKELIDSNTFPWAISVHHRKSLLSKEFENLPIEEYVRCRYEDTLKKVPILKGESKEQHRMREMFYLNMKWFMVTLLNRKDRMSMNNSLEVRVPFADHRLVEYAYNIPNEMKFYKDREKGLLRDAFKTILPKEIIERKKSPYPKTHNPLYTSLVQQMMMEIIQDKSSPIFQVIDKKVVTDIVKTKGEAFKAPWYGQLMTGPQVIAFLIQFNTWLKEYNVKIDRS